MRVLIGIFFILFTLGAAVKYLPLSWIGGPVSAHMAEPRPVFSGTVWAGQIDNIPNINPIHITTSPKRFFAGEPPLDFKSVSPFLAFSGTAGLGPTLTLKADGQMEGLSAIDNRFAGVAGGYSLVIDKMTIKETCTEAEGRFHSDVLRKNSALWNWQGPELNGDIFCEDGQLVIKITGADGGQEIDADIRLEMSGHYRAVVTVNTRDARADNLLPLFGFEKAGGGFRLSEAGTWQ